MTVYSGNPKIKSNLYSRKYFDSNGNLCETIFYGREIFTTLYKYDKNKKLVEEFQCSHNCKNGYRTIMKYDSLDRLIGKYKTSQKSINIDTCSVEQIYFYDVNNRLIKEQTWNANGYVNWKSYNYDIQKKISEIEISNKDTIWWGTYTYDNKGKLLAIKRQNGEKFKNETFEYDSLDKLVLKKTESDKKINGKKTYEFDNMKTIYKYNQSGQLIEEIYFSWNEDSHSSFIYQYDKKNAR